MRHPRISINDDVWAQARARAAGTNTTISTVVEDALKVYLERRRTDLTPNFTGAVAEPDLVGVETRRDKILGRDR